MQEVVENSLQSSENSLQCDENSLQITENEELPVAAEKKQRGRPKVSTDKTPRKRTVIREEPAIAAIAVAPVEVVPAAAPAIIDIAPAVAVPPVIKKRRTIKGPAIPTSEAVRMNSIRLVQDLIGERPPLSPRSLLRQTGEAIYALQNQRDSARREYWSQ